MSTSKTGQHVERLGQTMNYRFGTSPVLPGASGRGKRTHRHAQRKRSWNRLVRRLGLVLDRFKLPFSIRPAHALDLAAGSGWQQSKLASGAVCVLMLSLLIYFHVEDVWFVYHEDVSFGPLTYVESESLYELAGVEGWNIFWLRADEIRERLRQEPFVADAWVEVSLPGRVNVQIVEREPVALWVTKHETYWLTSDGATLPVREDGPPGDHLPQIVDVLMEARSVESMVGAAGGDHGIRPAMDRKVLESALTLVQLMPELNNQVRFNQDIGLNFALPGNIAWVYWGDGSDVDTKLLNVEAARMLLAEQAAESGTGEIVTGQIVDVRFANRPYLR